MFRTKTPTSLYVCGVFIIVVIALAATSLATTHWIEWDLSKNTTIEFGLFQYCDCHKSCYSYDEGMYTLDPVETVRVLLICGTVCYGVTLLILASLLCGIRVIEGSKKIGWATLALCIVGAILAFCGVAHFVYEAVTPEMESREKQWNYGYSLYLAPCSGTLSVVAGILALRAVTQGYIQNNGKPAVTPSRVKYTPSSNSSFVQLQFQKTPNPSTVSSPSKGEGGAIAMAPAVGGYNHNKHQQGSTPSPPQPQYPQQGIAASSPPSPPLLVAAAGSDSLSASPSMVAAAAPSLNEDRARKFEPPKTDVETEPSKAATKAEANKYEPSIEETKAKTPKAEAKAKPPVVKSKSSLSLDLRKPPMVKIKPPVVKSKSSLSLDLHKPPLVKTKSLLSLNPLKALGKALKHMDSFGDAFDLGVDLSEIYAGSAGGKM